MPSVELSERVYRKAEAAAQAEGVSIEEYVEHALDPDSEDELFVLSPEQEAMIRERLARVKAGEFLTMDQVEAALAKNRADWKAAHP